MKITIEIDDKMVHDLSRHIERIKVYEMAGFADPHPTDAILLKVQRAVENGK